MRFATRLVWGMAVLVALAADAAAQTLTPWADDFESYQVGIDPTNPPMGGWQQWPFGPLPGALISNSFASNGTRSLFNGGSSDILHLFNETSGHWALRGKAYIPSSGPQAMTIDAWFIMLHQYSAFGPKDWAMQFNFDPATGTMTHSLGPNNGVSMPYTPDTWIDIEVQIDLDLDSATCFIDGVQFGAPWQWTQGTGSSTSAPAIQALDLWSNLQGSGTNPNGGPFYDEFSLGPIFTRFCTAKTSLVCGAASIGAVGVSSVSASSGFRVFAAPTRGCRQGLVLYTNQSPVPGANFGGPGNGLLCLPGMGLQRAGPIDSGGSSAFACDGELAIDMNAFASSNWSSSGCSPLPGQNAPAGFLSSPGNSVSLQVWGRDSTSTGQVLSDGLSYLTAP